MSKSTVRQLSEGQSRSLTFQDPGYTITLSEETPTNVAGVHLARVGSYRHPIYGDFEITHRTLSELQRNFDQQTYGQLILTDIEHNPRGGAAAEITRLYIDGDWLKGDMELTPFGKDSIKNKRFIYLSVDYDEDWEDPATGISHGPVLKGAAHTTRPFIKNQPGIRLAEGIPGDNENKIMKIRQQFLKYLSDSQAGGKLTAALTEKFDAAVLKLGETPTAEQKNKLLTDYKGLADLAIKQLAELPVEQRDRPINLSITTGGLTKEDVDRQLAERDQQQAQARTAQEKKLSDNQASFKALIDAAEGISDSTKKKLLTASDLITAEMTESQIKKLAEHQLSHGNELEVSRQLAEAGFHVAGNPSVRIDAEQNITSLQERIDAGLRTSRLYGAPGERGLRLAEGSSNSASSAFLDKVLSEFDRLHSRELAAEHRMLSDPAGNSTTTSNAVFPATMRRTLIREAYWDLNIFSLVQTLVDSTATKTTDIPFEQRFDGQIPNEGVVYEGQGITSAGVSYDTESVHLVAMKLALILSEEVMHFSSTSIINWNAWGENISSNSRLIRELIHMRLANEMVRASDSYLAKDVLNEAVTANGTGQIKTAKFPVVRPYIPRNLKGQEISLPENPIVIKEGTTELDYYTGADDLAAGFYWKFNSVNMGYIQIVDEKGAPAGDGKSLVISYSYATNIAKFDKTAPEGTTYKNHLNDFMDMIGDQSAMMNSHRFVNPEFAAMSRMLNNEASKASQFAVSLKRDGTDTNSQGDLEAIKSLPTFNTNAPGVDFGDQRTLIGQRGVTSYVIAKPYTVGQPFEAVDSRGRPTGMKKAYGTEFNGIYTPKAVRNRYSSVLFYDKQARDAA